MSLLRKTSTIRTVLLAATLAAIALALPSSAYAFSVSPPTITGGPSGAWSSTSATFTYSRSGTVVAFDCQLDGGGYSNCGLTSGSGSKSYTGLNQGSHTFSVKVTVIDIDPCAIVVLGNCVPGLPLPYTSAPATRSWTVDTIAPDTTITSPAKGTISDDTPSFTFSSTEAGSFQCKVDAASYSGCGSPKTLSTLANGAHTFYVRSIDAAGNSDPTPAAESFAVDTVGPTVTITAGPANGSTIDTATTSFSFTAAGSPTEYQCSIDGAAFAVCTSPKSLAGLSEILHAFSVKAKDAVGNFGATVTRTFTVDLPEPIVAPPPALLPPTGTTNPVAGQKSGACATLTGRKLRRCLARQRCLKKYKGSVKKMSAKKKKARAKCLAKAKKRK